jgi:hypothetical protein
VPLQRLRGHPGVLRQRPRRRVAGPGHQHRRAGSVLGTGSASSAGADATSRPWREGRLLPGHRRGAAADEPAQTRHADPTQIGILNAASRLPHRHLERRSTPGLR